LLAKRLVWSTLGVLILFNIVAVLVLSTTTVSSWPFPELGVSVFQDSYHNRAPILESPFGVIGDIPGGYPFYAGSPLVGIPVSDRPSSVVAETGSLTVCASQPGIDMLILALAIAIIPLSLVILLGRRSYGMATTR